MKKKAIILFAGLVWLIFVYSIALAANASAIKKDFEPIMGAAKSYLISHSAKQCWNADIKPIRVMGDWALATVEPDMKNCTSDPIWLVMHKENGKRWVGFTLGSCCFDGVPAALFGGDAKLWPTDKNGIIIIEGEELNRQTY